MDYIYPQALVLLVFVLQGDLHLDIPNSPWFLANYYAENKPSPRSQFNLNQDRSILQWQKCQRLYLCNHYYDLNFVYFVAPHIGGCAYLPNGLILPFNNFSDIPKILTPGKFILLICQIYKIYLRE